ncbi:MAG: 4Fe-4S cluster-binding domain-containing protein [Clostridia bacterium]|nr:4Fe-4S cluster-binding domain-containing protein [Clostridia bacterium]
MDDYYRLVSGFQHFRTDLGDGMQTAVYINGCLGRCAKTCACPYLPEHDVGIDETEKKRYTADELIAYLLEEKKWCASRRLTIAFLGGEPLSDPWYCFHVAKALKKAGMGVVFSTCGNAGENALFIVREVTDLFIFELYTIIPSA